MSEVQTAESLAAPGQQAIETNTEAVQQGEQQAGSQEAGEEQQGKKHDSPEWAQRRINELTRKRYEEKARADYLAQENERLRGARQDGEQTQQPVRQEDIEARAERLAEQKIAARQQEAKIAEVRSSGAKEFKAEFDTAISTLQSLGAMDNDPQAIAFSAAVLESDVPHKVLHYLGTNPDEATRILSLNPVQQARAIGLIEARLATATPNPPSVSKAPPPVKPLGSRSSAPNSLEHLPNDDIETFMKKERERAKARRG